MHPILRNIIAVTLGWFTGSLLNMSLIKLGHILQPIDGLDPNDLESLKAMMPDLEPNFFIFPFLAHALGTLAGAIVAGLIAFKNKMKFAMVIGVLFLIGGIFINYLLASPIWYYALDVVLAYFPMAWIGGKLALRFSGK